MRVSRVRRALAAAVPALLLASGCSSSSSSVVASSSAASTPAGAAGTSTSAAASSSSAPASSASAVDTTPVTLDYFTFSAAPDHLKDLDTIIAAFTASHPNITIKVDSAPYGDYFTKLQTAIAGGTAPDAFELDYGNFVTFADSGALLDLGAASPDKDYKPDVLSETSMKSFQYQDKQFGLPESFSAVLLYYNKDVFDKAKVAYPTAHWTWKDEWDAAQKLTDAGAGVYGDFQPITYYEYYKAVAQAGGTFFSEDGKSATFNSAEGVAAANWLIQKSGVSMPDYAKVSSIADYDTKLFKSGKLGMWHNGNWQFTGLKDAPIKWDVVVEPGDKAKASAIFQNAVAVSASTKNATAASAWVQFLSTSEASLKARVDSAWELPPVSDTSSVSSYLTQTPPTNRQAVFDSLKAQAATPVTAKQQQMVDIVNKALANAAAKRTPVQAALDDAAKQVTALLQQ